MSSEAKTNLEKLGEQWVVESAESDLGLWWLADDLRECLGDEATEEEVLTATLAALRPLLESGRLRAVTLLKGGEFEVWRGEVTQQLSRVAEAWRAVGKPTIGDVVWFIGERS
jgi:hypothetical protein